MERESMVFYKSFFDAIKDLPPEDFKKCACAILEYGLDGRKPVKNGLEKTVYLMAKPQIDKNNQRYENGKRGGRPANQSEPNKNQTETETNQSEPNKNQTETETKNLEPNVNVNVNDNVNVNYITHSPRARAREESDKKMTCADFLAKYPNVYPDVNAAIYDFDWDLLDEKFQASTKYLQGEPHDLSWVKSNYRRIIGDVYKDKPQAERSTAEKNAEWYEKTFGSAGV